MKRKSFLCVLTVLLILLGSHSLISSNLNIVQTSRLYNSWASAEDIVIRDDYAFVAAGLSGLQILDVSDIDSIRIVSFFDGMPGISKSVCVDSCFAYLANQNGNFVIFDIQDLENPLIVAQCSDINKSSDIIVGEGFAYVADDDRLVILDIHDPSHPQIIAVYDLGDSEITALTKHHDLLYISCFHDPLAILDVSDPSNPVEFEAGRACHRYNIAFVDDIGFEVGPSGSACGFLVISDYSDPIEPVRLGYCETWNKAEELIVDGDFVYTIGGSQIDGFCIIDISDLENPVADSMFFVYLCSYSSLALNSQFALVTKYAWGICGGALEIFDIEHPHETEFLHEFKPRGFTPSISLYNNLAILPSDNSLVRLVDVSDPATPQPVCDLSAIKNVQDMVIAGDYGYGIGYKDFVVLDLSDIQAPDSIGGYEIPIQSIFRRLVVEGDYAYILTGYDNSNYDTHVIVLDVSDKTNPQRIDRKGLHGNPRNLKIFGDVLFAATGRSLSAFDVSDIESIELIAEVFCGTGNFDIKDNLLFVSRNYYSTQYIYILDITDMEEVIPLDTLQTLGCVEDLYLDGDYLYVCERETGIEVFNVKDIHNVHRAGFYDTPGIATELVVRDNIAYLADQSNFGIYDCSQVLSADTELHHTPSVFSLLSAYPNPFNSSATITYSVSSQSDVLMQVYNVNGQLVDVLVDGAMSAGRHSVSWDGKEVSAGVYLVRMMDGRGNMAGSCQKVLLLK